MAEVSFSKDTYHTYMVIKGNDGEGTDDEERMMCNQQAAVLLPFHVQQLDDKKDYYYDITGKVDFMEYVVKQQADLELIEYMIRFLVKLCHVVDEYLLSLDSLLLDEKFLYINVDAKALYVPYVPGMKASFNEQLQQLSACLLEHTNHKDKEGVLLVYEFYRTIRREDFNPGLLSGLLKMEVQQSGEQEITAAPYDEQKVMDDDAMYKQQPDVEKEEKGVHKNGHLLQIAAVGFCLLILLLYKLGYMQKGVEAAGLNIDAGYIAFGLVFIILLVGFCVRRFREKKGFLFNFKSKKEENVWDDMEFENSGVYSLTDESLQEIQPKGDDRTMILSGTEGGVRLVSLNKNVAADLVVMQFPCIVGSRRHDAQAVIEAAGISRRHAILEKDEGGICLMDLHSTNGTRVNGNRLAENERKRLLVEDVIEFADVRYMYCGGGKTGY